jgi:hypothetical protein
VTFKVTMARRTKPRVRDLRGKAIPQLAQIGRRREDQPPCCDDLDEPPIDQDLVDLVNALRAVRR